MENIKFNSNPELVKKLAAEAQASVLDTFGQPAREAECFYNPGDDEVKVVEKNKAVDAIDELKEEYNLEVEKN